MASLIEIDVETESERDLAATAERLGRVEAMPFSVSPQYHIFHAGADDGLRLPATGAIISGRLTLLYCDAKPGKAARSAYLVKSMGPGSSYSVGVAETVAFRVDGPTKVLGYAASALHIPPVSDLPETTTHWPLPSSDPLDVLQRIDYDDLTSLHSQGERLLNALADDRPQLRALLEAALVNPSLRRKCESLPDMLKYVLYEAPNGARVRLHIFRTDYDDVPHSHRWPMCSLTLRGPVTNRYYGFDEKLEQEYEGRVPPVRIAHRLTDRSVYSFSPQLVHWFHGAPGSATLTIRGPLRQSLGNEFGDGGRGFKYGVDANMEPDYTMTDYEFDHGIRHLKSANIL